MSWQLTFAPHAKAVRKSAEAAGAPIPESCYPPSLDSYQHRILAAFWELSTCRHLAMGAAGPIPWDKKDLYAHRNGFMSDEISYDDFMEAMRACDDEFLANQAENLKSKGARNADRGSAGEAFVRSRAKNKG